MQHATIQMGRSCVHVIKVFLEMEQIVQILMNVLNLHATPMQHVKTQLARLCVHVTKVLLEMEQVVQI
jgi:glutamate formiminotransferase